MLGALDRNSYTAFWTFWIKARNRTTNVIEEGGVWTGVQDRVLPIGGMNRTYLGGGHIIGLDKLSYVAGASNIQSQVVQMNGMSPAAEEMIRTFESRQAQFEIHRVRPANQLSLSGTWIVEQAFIGNVDDVRMPRSAADDDGAMDQICTMTLMSVSRMGTRTLPLKKSDAAQKLTDPNDKGRQYSSAKAKVTWMGETKNPHRVGAYAAAMDGLKRFFG